MRQYYMPVQKKSTNPNVFAFPFRRTKSGFPTRRSQSSSPGMMLPDLTVLVENIIPAPPTIDTDVARRIMNEFRGMASIMSSSCAISGLGRQFRGCPVRPSLQACHIVSQLQYNLYPLSKDDLDDLQLATTATAAAVPQDRLQQQWIRTWSISNSIMLMSHLREAFDQRLISIHPRTHVIRAFVEYDALLLYHGKMAQFGRSPRPDSLALWQHWKACCIENMAALTIDPIEGIASGALSSATTPALAPSGSAPPDNDDGQEDDVPPKRRTPQEARSSLSSLHQELSRTTSKAGRDDDSCDANGRTLPDSGLGSLEDACNDGSISPSHQLAKRKRDEHVDGERVTKRQQQQLLPQQKWNASADSAVTAERRLTGDWTWDNTRFITPYNAEQFMVELHWKLRRHRNA